MDTLRNKEIAFISGYIRKNYYKKLKKKNSLNHNTIIDNGIILIIHNYCKPLLLKSIDAMPLSGYIHNHRDGKAKWIKEWNEKYISSLKQYPDHIKLVVLGAGSMGKTCLLIRYTTNDFPGEYIPTVFDNYSANITIDKVPINLGLWDTAGGEDYPRLRPLSYPQTDVFMICMSVCDNPADRSWEKDKIDKSGMWSNSAVHTMAFCQEAEFYCPLAPRVLIGTKIDLRDDKECMNMCYSKEEMQHFADIWGCDAYFECSALKDYNMKETFDGTIRVAMKNIERLLKPNKSKKDCIVL